MKNLIIVCLFALGTLSLSAQNEKTAIEKGTILQIATPSSQEYKHIDFPRNNIIIKRGGIASNNLVIGKKVVVTKVTQLEDGTTQIRVKPADKSRFYNAISSVTLHYENALASQEIQLL